MQVLLLCHRIPFPPDKGDKIRSYRWLKALAQRHAVHLGCFIDDPQDWAQIDRVGEWCASMRAFPLPRWRRAWRGAAALARREALTASIYRDQALAAWVRERLAAGGIGCAVAFSSAMAGYCYDAPPGMGRILDFVDVDSEKWGLLAARAAWPKRALLRREAAHLAIHDRQMVSRFDLACFVSGAEAERFEAMALEGRGRLCVLRNGVDAAFFDPTLDHANPYGAGGPVLAFTGAMNYAPNEEAVAWFATQVLPRLRSSQPALRFAIVGRSPSRKVRQLRGIAGVEVVGTVPDIRPYLAHAAAVVAPLRATIGVPNKILEALAMARPVVATPEAVRPLDFQPGRDLLIASGAEDFASAVREALSESPRTAAIGAQARHRVAAEYDWARVERQMQALVEEAASIGLREAPRRGARA
jgi:sugar transferase (PEP-CTERM/EpsH1 system associated)